MISIDLIRNDPVFVQKQLSLKDNSISLDTIIKLDQSYRTNLSRVNDLRSKRNKVSEDIANAKRAGKNTDDDIVAMRQVSDKIKSLEQKANGYKEELDTSLLGLPNLPHESVPEGKDEKNNKIIREWGKPKDQNFEI